MLYFVALLLPPVAVWSVGKPGQALLNLLLCLLMYFPGALHALLVVSNHYADRRSDRIIAAMSGGTSRGGGGSHPPAESAGRRAFRSFCVWVAFILIVLAFARYGGQLATP